MTSISRLLSFICIRVLRIARLPPGATRAPVTAHWNAIARVAERQHALCLLTTQLPFAPKHKALAAKNVLQPQPALELGGLVYAWCELGGAGGAPHV